MPRPIATNNDNFENSGDVQHIDIGDSAKTTDKEDLELAALTLQLEQFLTVFIENTTAVMFKAMVDTKIKPKDVYHQYRQLLLYVESLHQMMYSPILAEDLINKFDNTVPYNLQAQDEHMFENYIKFFQGFFSDFADNATYQQRTEMNRILKKVQHELEQDYGYEPHLQRQKRDFIKMSRTKQRPRKPRTKRHEGELAQLWEEFLTQQGIEFDRKDITNHIKLLSDYEIAAAFRDHLLKIIPDAGSLEDLGLDDLASLTSAIVIELGDYYVPHFERTAIAGAALKHIDATDYDEDEDDE